MIGKQIDINIGNRKAKVFISNGFFDFVPSVSSMHRHIITEVQLIAKGSGKISIDGKIIELVENDVIVIPKNQFHQRTEFEKEAQIITFQTTENVSKYKKFHLNPYIIKDLLREIDILKKTGESIKLAIYLELISAEFTSFAKDIILPVENREFIISEFFALNYSKNISLSDLANTLNLSDKQTERLLVKYTGETFKKNLTKHRIEAASQLMAEGQKTLSDIAEQVGYKSYSGFWKAYNNIKG